MEAVVTNDDGKEVARGDAIYTTATPSTASRDSSETAG